MTLKGNWILGSWVLGRQNWEGALRLHHSLVSHEDHQAGGPQYRLATERLDTEQAWGSPPRMILSFLPQPNYILETSVLVTTERGVYWHLGGKARDAAKHPAVHRQPQQQRSIWPQMLMLPRRRGGRQHRGGGYCVSYGQGHGEKQEPRSKMFPLTSDHGNTSPNLNRAAFFIWKFGIICKLIPNLGQACTERHSPRLLLASKLAYVSSTLKRLILT